LLVTASAPGMLDGWIDFNNDGDFLDQFEHVYASYPLQAGINEVPLTIPANASIGPRFARFRFSSQGGLAPTGLAVDGEVEDYLIQIFSNRPPVLTVPGPLVVEEDVPSPIAGISVFDADAGPLPIVVTVTVLNGTLTVNTNVSNGLVPADVQGNGTGRLVLTGTQTQISNTLAHATGLIYQTVSNFNGDDLLTIVADDLGNFGTGGARQDLRTVPLTVLPINDPPEVTVPGTQFVDEDSVLVFAPGSIGVFDVEHDREEVPADTPYRLTLTVGNGSLMIRNNVAGGILADEIQGNGTRTVVVLAPLDRINTTLASSSNLTYTPDPNFDDRDVLTLILNDLGSFGAGGPQQDTQTVAIEIRAINDAPVVTVPGDLTINENTPWNMAGFNVWDVDSGATPIVVTLMVSGRSDGQLPSGTLRFVDTSALDFSAGDILNPIEGSVITIEAPVARISALLSNPAAWQYVPPPNFGGDVDSGNPAYEIVTILAEDRGASGDEVPPEPKSDTQSLTIFLREVNDPPQITAPATAVVDEDQLLHFTGLNAVSIADPDLGSGQMAVTVTATSGTVAMGAAPPAISLSLLGSLSDINAALATLRFQGNLNYHGPASVVIHADDQGNTPPPAQQTTHTIAITVNPVNDPPVITMPGPLSVLENRSLSIPNVSVTDVDAFEGGSDGVLTVKLSVAAMTALESGTLNVAANVPGGLPSSAIRYSHDGVVWTSTGPAPQVRLTGTQNLINTTLASTNGLVFRGAADDIGTVQLTVFADDGGKWPPTAGQSTSQATQVITIRPSRPTLVNPIGTVNVLEDAPDRRIELYPGVFDYAGTDPLTFLVTQNNNPSLVEATIDGTMLVLNFLQDQSGTARISVTASDGRHSATDEFDVIVTQVPDPPFVANPIPDVTVLLGTQTYTVDLRGVFDDPDIPFGDSLTLSFNDQNDNTNRNVVTGQLINQETLRLTFGNIAGRSVLTVRARDQLGAETSDSFVVIVNAPPTAQDDQATTSMHLPVAIQVTGNDTDPDGVIDQRTVQIVSGSGPANGTVTVDPTTGVVTYTPNLSYWNRNHPRENDRPLDTFRYTVRDDGGALSNEATVSLTVNWRPLYQNPGLPEDVNGDGFVSPIDVLILINYLNSKGPSEDPGPSRELPDVLWPDNPSYPPPPAGQYYDVLGNGLVMPQDVLRVINYLNGVTGSPGAEGEASVAGAAMSDSAPTDAAAMLVVADYSLSPGTLPTIDMGLQPADDMASDTTVDQSRDWNTVSAGSSREAEFDVLAGGQSDSVIDQVLDELLGDIASDVDGNRTAASAADWVLGRLV
jgi:hypothetical protein